MAAGEPFGQMTRMPFSESVNGEPVHLTGTTTGTSHLIHQVSGKGYDSILIWIANRRFGNTVVTIEWTVAGVTGDVNITVPIWAGAALANAFVVGIPLRNGATIKAYADFTEVCNVYGYVSRYS